MTMAHCLEPIGSASHSQSPLTDSNSTRARVQFSPSSVQTKEQQWQTCPALHAGLPQIGRGRLSCKYQPPIHRHLTFSAILFSSPFGSKETQKEQGEKENTIDIVKKSQAPQPEKHKFHAVLETLKAMGTSKGNAV
ncbi:unnamed protein product [Merluccius merluccius]